MPLPFVLIIAVIAIAGLALLLNRLGFGEQARLTSQAQARALFEAEHPGISVAQVLLSGDGRSALLTVRGDDRHLGFIQSLGDAFLTRLLGPGDIAAVDKSSENALDITFTDFTYPRARMHFGSDSDTFGRISDAFSKLFCIKPGTLTDQSPGMSSL